MTKTIKLAALRGFALLTASAAALCFTTSCDDDDNNDDDLVNAPKEYVTALQALFPTAKNVNWEKKVSYIVAEFKNDKRQDMEVWFATGAKWAMTATDLGRDKSQLPTEVITTITASDYNVDWYLEDIDLYERADGLTYVIEYEREGYPDTDLAIKPDGTLVKVMTGTYGEITPDTKF